MYKQWGDIGACPGGSGTSLSSQSWPSDAQALTPLRATPPIPWVWVGAVGGDSNAEREVSPVLILNIIPPHRDPLGWYVEHSLPLQGPCVWLLSSFLESECIWELDEPHSDLPHQALTLSLSLSDATVF